jgi:DNA (cytosine-5)-methyltransferase 1
VSTARRASGIVVDLFAGGGGASTGIEAALGRPIDVAINHSPAAVAVHHANHPQTAHHCQDVWEADPRTVCAGRPVALLWASPDCTHFSRAKGGRPRSKRVRSLARVVTRWARDVRPAVILLENVEEFTTWGPLGTDGRPIARQHGRTFRAWVRKLEGYGYRVEHRALVAADFGAPTTRKRLFVVARCDAQSIRWPAPTHGRGRAHAWRSAAECIDWSLPCPSIFERKRALADATLRRIAAGVRRYVLDAAAPFIIPVTHPRDARVHGVDEPFRTVTAANRGELALVTPFVARTDMHQSNAGCVFPPSDPLRTVTTSGGFALVAPTLITAGYGERPGQTPRVPGLEKPLGTVVAGGRHHALVAAFLSKHYTGVVGQQPELPLGTVTVREHYSLGTAVLSRDGAARGAQVRAFLTKYYGADGRAESQQSLFEPLHTVTTRDRFGLVTIAGEDYAIADIGMRMLAPHELFAAQGFPREYVIAPALNGRPLTRTAQIELAGNSVPPCFAEALVRANFTPAATEAA